MIVVIQCAARKREHAGFLWTRHGKRVVFVADPTFAPARADCIYARPDDPSDQGGSWRDVLVRYNGTSGDNPLGLLQASELYGNNVYRALCTNFGSEKVYILSAGWGLISATFLTPYYDITFSPTSERWKRRKNQNKYDDFSFLSEDIQETIVFLGGRNYLPLFTHLTSNSRSSRIVFYNSAIRPDAPGCSLVRFPTTTRTNWHYECARALLQGKLSF